MILEKQPELLADAIRAASEYYHIAPVYIEKDYWISKILQQLSRSVYMENTVFKGGTSLSKGYGLINRFSEDVDVAVLTQKLSGNQIKTLISKVCKEMTQGLQEQVVPELTSKGSRYRKALYQYPASVHDPLFDFVANRVVVEINSFANPYPYVRRQIKSFITSYLENTGMDSFIEEYDLHPFELNILDKRRTLCEKVVSLLRFSFMDNPVQGLTGKIRHFYDIYFLLTIGNVWNMWNRISLKTCKNWRRMTDKCLTHRKNGNIHPLKNLPFLVHSMSYGSNWADIMNGN